MVQDHDYVLGLWPDGRDIDGPRRKEKGLNRAVNTTDVWAHWCVCVFVCFLLGDGTGWSELRLEGGGWERTAVRTSDFKDERVQLMRGWPLSHVPQFTSA